VQEIIPTTKCLSSHVSINRCHRDNGSVVSIQELFSVTAIQVSSSRPMLLRVVVLTQYMKTP